MLFDWMLPDMDGEQMLQWVRTNLDTRVPVIFLTNVASEEQIAGILRMGADDYVVKPPRRLELLARIEAVLRRVTPEQDAGGAIEAGRFRIFPAQRRIERDGATVQLTAKEYELAGFLFANVGRLLSRDHLLKSIWGLNDNVATRTLDTHISKVRSKLGLTPDNGYRIASVQNFGYRLERYVHEAAD